MIPTYEALVLNKTPLILERTPIVTFGYIIQVTLSLGIVLALIYLTSKYLLPKLQGNISGKTVKILDRIILEPQVCIYVIKLGQTKYLVGVSNKNISVIDKLKEEELT